ncbi:putative bifunctional diguanylate cyclase/phosphodiesterase [Microvirga terricola]|uniref:EAL domain-containing protein n=1 Tax=Microvirga terricola TaxID=2719797 RepID=A0ABX0V5S0_9HYPH|nr:EAL domain-containing protein [Microvirga terricola]NIX75067.1 EAL domain-containing protein [Microvirga terricola]
MPHRTLTPFGGEFLAPEREAAFQTERLPETLRHVQLLFLLSAVLNSLFFLSDWRFYGQPHFYAAIPARVVVVAIALICLWTVRRSRSFAQAEKSMIAWEWVNSAAVAVLVSSHSDLALFVVLMLPSIYYLALPTSFRWSIISGIACSAMMFGGYMLPEPASDTTTGLFLAIVMLNLALFLVVSRSNRLQRLEWMATQAERRTKEELIESRTMFETMFKTVPIPLLVVRMDGSLVATNDAAVRYMGATADALGIKTIDELYVEPNDRNAFLDALRKDGQVSNFETRVRLADRSIHTVLLAGATIDIGGEPHIMTGVIDITERKSTEERVWRAASHDPLTGLPNRAFFQSRLEQSLAQAERNGTRINLFLIDLDNLKSVNDTLGHDAGDILIKKTASRLHRMMRENDTVARLAGDEFAIIVVDPFPLEDPQTLAEQILADLRRPFAYRDGHLASQASIGIASYPHHDRAPSELMRDADLALYAAKAMGRNRTVVYSPDMREKVEQRASITRDIREALRQGQIVPFYQPKIDLQTGKVVGFEALARWHHLDQGLLTPAAFQTAFEEPELSIAVGEQILKQVAADIRKWLDEGIDCGTIAVNLSPAQFNWIGLAKRFLEIIQAAGVPPERLAVEITETVFLGSTASHVVTALKEFHDNGIRIALDDFGTGYASLVHLKQFPIDDIKIDQSFVKDVESDADSAAIVLAVIELGTSLGMEVIAEGVETIGQVDFLRRGGCTQAQGNFYAAPMSSCQVAHFLNRREAECA